MRNQDKPQGRHFGFSSETNRDRFLDVHSGPARGRQRASTPRLWKGRQVWKDMEHFPLPEAAQSTDLPGPSQMAAQHHLLTPGLDLCPTGMRTRKKRTKIARKVPHPPASPLSSLSLHPTEPDTLTQYSTHTCLLYMVPWTKDPQVSRKHQETRCSWSPQQVCCLLATKNIRIS